VIQLFAKGMDRRVKPGDDTVCVDALLKLGLEFIELSGSFNNPCKW